MLSISCLYNRHYAFMKNTVKTLYLIQKLVLDGPLGRIVDELWLCPLIIQFNLVKYKYCNSTLGHAEICCILVVSSLQSIIQDSKWYACISKRSHLILYDALQRWNYKNTAGWHSLRLNYIYYLINSCFANTCTENIILCRIQSATSRPSERISATWSAVILDSGDITTTQTFCNLCITCLARANSTVNAILFPKPVGKIACQVLVLLWSDRRLVIPKSV